MKNIVLGNKGLNNTRHFWIGGSTNYSLNSSHFRYSDYIANDSGE